MRIITSAQEMSNYARSNDGVIGFVPTMGALHGGHISLIERARNETDVAVVSVFVNPTQFNDPEDLKKYPRTFQSDRDMIESAGADVMFYPNEVEVYPSDQTPRFDLDGLDGNMEGSTRPGHFNGVIQVVTRLFDLIKPTKAYFGEKDFQQLTIIRHMTKKLGYDTQVIGCPTLREPDGLAMSSRNVRLDPNSRSCANFIYRSLLYAVEHQTDLEVEVLKDRIVAQYADQKDMKLEYFEFVNPETLRTVTDWSGPVQVCAAAWVGGVRLIDNMQVK